MKIPIFDIVMCLAFAIVGGILIGLRLAERFKTKRNEIDILRR